MSIEVTSRHIDADSHDKEYALDLGERIVDHFPRVEHVHVIHDSQKHLYFAEMLVQAKDHIRVDAKERSVSIRTALDICCDKAERQFRKLRDKVQDHKARAPDFEQAQ